MEGITEWKLQVGFEAEVDLSREMYIIIMFDVQIKFKSVCGITCIYNHIEYFY